MTRLWIIFVVGLLACTVKADDTDLFGKVPANDIPKIMLLVDTSLSMGVPAGSSGIQNAYRGDCSDGNHDTVKLCVVKNELRKFLEFDPNNAAFYWPDTLEVGLAQYAEPGGIILAPVAPLGDGSAGSHRKKLIDILNRMKAASYTDSANNSADLGVSTPIIGSYLEVASYLTGGAPVSQFSRDYSDPAVWDDGVDLGAKYKGIELTQVCDAPNNHIIVLTDGESTCEKTYGGADATELSLYNVCSANSGNVLGATLGQRIGEFSGLGATDYAAACGDNIATLAQQRFVGETFSRDYWGCLNTIAQTLEQRQSPAPDSVSEKIKTHVIAYDLDVGALSDPDSVGYKLNQWATYGNGMFQDTNSGSDLANAIKAAFPINTLSGAFTAATGGVAAGQVNSFSYIDEIYFSTITPTDKPVWYGNLKKYYLKLETNNQVGIYAANKTDLAVEDGVFVPGVVSEWSQDVYSANYNASDDKSVKTDKDGNIAHIGGAASQIEPPDSRKLIAYLNNNPKTLTSSALSSTTDGLTDIKSFMLNDTGSPAVGTPAYDDYLVKIDSMLLWLRGDDVGEEWLDVSGELTDTRPSPDNGVRTLYGAPLHSSPRIVNYRSKDINGDDLADPDDIVFVSSNDGKLYAVDSDTGEEKLAYMPQAMFERSDAGGPSKIEQMYDAIKDGTSGGLIYGLDSSWTVWRQDRNNDGNIDAINDFVYLYGGMRRGGRNYYILDATKVNDASPEIEQLRVVEGGESGTPFEKNGQTWSEPTLALINFKGRPVVVFIVGGGYDEEYDSARPSSLPAAGAQIHIVVARTFTVSGVTYNAGDVLWWASSNTSLDSTHVKIDDLKYSIPSTVKTLYQDDGDFLLDHIYVGDMGGQILRFDINNSNTGSADFMSNASISGNDVVVARLGAAGRNLGTTSFTEDRRFFYPPSVALMKNSAGTKFVGIAIGSGWRSNPLDEQVDEKFYFLMDYEPFPGAGNQNIIEEGTAIESVSFVSDPDNITALSDAVTRNSSLRGYSIELNERAEKLLGSPLIVGGTVVFSTYYRDSQPSTNSCTPETGFAAFYSYTPGDAQAVQAKGFSQNGAGSILPILGNLADDNGSNGNDSSGSDEKARVPMLSGTGSPPGPDFNMRGIRKTRWYRVD